MGIRAMKVQATLARQSHSLRLPIPSANTTKQAIYQTDLYAEIYQTDLYAENLTFAIQLPPGTFDMYLHFAEIFVKEGSVLLTSTLLVPWWQTIGTFSRRREGMLPPILENNGINLSDGTLTIELFGVEENAKISVIEIRPAPTAVDPLLASGRRAYLHLGNRFLQHWN
jgi:hypothetical protein